jgi:hypothetical protein
MAKVYNPPSELKVPDLDFKKFHEYDGNCKKYKEDLKKLLIEKYGRTGEGVGEVIQFPAADGYAEYMVASLKPVELIHLPLGDAWSFEYANRLTAKDVREKIRQQNAIKELFSKKRAEQKKGE